MPLVTTASLVRPGAVVGAFNVVTLEHAEAIAAGAEAAGRPAILQVSHNAVRFHGGRLLPIAAACRAVAEAAGADLALHLDHVEDTELLHRAAVAGFSSAMVDAGALPWADNVRTTAAAASWAHDHGLWLEAELGHVGGKEPRGAHEPGVRTDPDEAARFVAETGVDALAVAVGSSHAMTSRTAVLDHALIAVLRDAVPVPLVLHGSSGVPDDELRRATAAGIVKVNVGTALNVAWTAAVRGHLTDGVTDPRRYLAPARDAAADVVRRLLGVLHDLHLDTGRT